MKQKLEAFIADILSRIERQTHRFEVGVTESSVTMKRRYRDYDLSDNLDTFKHGYWTNIPWSDRDFYAMNIIKPTVIANKSVLVSTNTKIDIEPRFSKDATTQRAAEVAKAIRDLKYDEQWTSDLMELITTEPQVSPGCFLRVRYDENAVNPYRSAVSELEWDEEEMSEGGKSVCKECGMETYGEETECPECAGEMEVVEESESTAMPVMKGREKKEEKKTGNTVTEFIPAAEIRIDHMGTQGGRLKNALWLEHHHLVPSWKTGNDIKTSVISVPLRWQLALQSGLDYYGGATVDADQVIEYVEQRDLYLRPEFLDQIEEVTADFEVGHFSIKAGQKLSEATYKGEPVGDRVLCFKTVGRQILDVYPCNFKTFDEEFIYFSYNTNPSSFWGLFLTELLPMQDVVNYMFTLQVFHTRRNARTTLIADRDAFDAEDLERDLAFTKEGYVRQPGESIGNLFNVVPALNLSGEPMGIINMMMQYKGDIGGVQPTMVGGDASNQGYTTASGQMMAKNQSMMLLSAFSQSIARGKEAWVRKQLIEAQRTWSEEQFSFLLKLNGEWTEEYINAFLECNLETDLVIQYVEGSEVPRLLMEREMALRNFVQDLLMLQQAMGQPLPPQVASDILQKIKQYTDVDIDVQNQNSELQLIDRRFDLLRRVTEGLEVPAGVAPEDVSAAALKIVTENPALYPFERENHAVAIEWLTDRMITLAQEEAPNRMLVECVKQMINLYEAAAVSLAQKATKAEIAAKQPITEIGLQQQAQQQEMAQQQAEQQRQQMLEDEQRKIQLEREAKYDDHALALEKEKIKSELSGNGQEQGADRLTVGV